MNLICCYYMFLLLSNWFYFFSVCSMLPCWSRFFLCRFFLWLLLLCFYIDISHIHFPLHLCSIFHVSYYTMFLLLWNNIFLLCFLVLGSLFNFVSLCVSFFFIYLFNFSRSFSYFQNGYTISFFLVISLSFFLQSIFLQSSIFYHN